MMLQNTGFEADWSEECSHRCLLFAPNGAFIEEREIGNVFTPPGWLTWFVHQPGTWDQPEVRDAWREGDFRRARSGEKGILLFTFSRKHDGGFLQQVSVSPGDTLRLSVWAHAWSNHRDPAYPERFPHPDDPWWSEGAGWAPRNEEHEPIGAKNWYLEGEVADDQWRNFTFRIGIDPTGGTNPLADTVVWGWGIHIYNEYTEPVPPVQVEAQATTATVFLRSTTLWPFKHNDAYWDDAELVAVGPSSTTTTTSTTTLSTTTTTLPPLPEKCRIDVLVPYLEEIRDTVGRMIEEIESVEPPPTTTTSSSTTTLSTTTTLPPVEPPPWAGMVPISLHVQQPTAHDGYGDLEFVRDVKPAGFKVIGHMQQLQRVKAVSPNTVTIYRQFVDNQGQYWDVDPRDGAREFLYTFLDSLLELQDSVDLVEGLNEIGVPSELTRLSDWYCHYADALAAEGSPAGPAVGSIPVGNPKLVSEGGRPLIEEMLPMVKAAVEHNGAVNYHGYYRVHNKVVNPPWDANWLCYAGRCLEDWDAVFREHGLYPNYIVSEAGAFLNALAGWRHDEVFDGNWGAYGQSLLELRERIDAWNAENNYRCICYTLFTYANPGIWQYYNLYGYARALAELLGG